jgi:hypothetical protein
VLVPTPACTAVQVSSQVQRVPSPAPLHDWCVGQVVSFTALEAVQVPSVVHTPWTVVLLQNVPGPVQPAGAGLQTQEALPAAPVQVAFVVHTVELAPLT